MKRLAVLAMAAALVSGCFRTTYTNLAPPTDAALTPVAATKPKSSGWQSFFLYGWIPDEKQIDAAAFCGGAEHVRAIETERSFLQGLVTSFAGFYVNIYSPFTGRVVCDDSKTR